MDTSRGAPAAQVKREFLARWPVSYLTNYGDSCDPLDFMTAVTAIQPASSYQRHLAPIGTPPVMFVSIPVDPLLGGDPDKLDAFAQYFRDTVFFKEQELFESAQYDHIETAVANTLLLPQCKNPLPLGAFNLTKRALLLARSSETEEAPEDAPGGTLSEFTLFFDFYFNLAGHALTVRVPSADSPSSPGKIEIPPNGYLVHRIDSGKVVPGSVDVAAPGPNAVYLYMRYTATRLIGMRTYEPSVKRRRLLPDRPDVSYAWSTPTGPQAVRLLREPRVSQRPRDLLLEDMIALPHLHFGLNDAASFIEQYLVNNILTTVADRKSLCDSLYVTPYDVDTVTPSPMNSFVRWGAVVPYEPGTFDMVLHAVYLTRGSVRIDFDYGNHRPLPYWPVNTAVRAPSDARLSFNLSIGKFIFFGNTQAFRLVPVGPAPEFRRFTYLLSTRPRSTGARKVSAMARDYGVQAEDNQAGADAWFTRVDPMGKPLSVMYATTMQYQSLPQIPESPNPVAPSSPLAEPSYPSPSQDLVCTVCEYNQASGDSFAIYREELATKVRARVDAFARDPVAWSGRLDLQPCATCQALLVRALYFYEDEHPMDVAFTWRALNFTPEVATSPGSPRRVVAAGPPVARPKGKRPLPAVPPKTPSPAEVSDGPLDLIRVILRQLGFTLRPSVSSTGFYGQLKDPSKLICQASIYPTYIREVLQASTILYQILLQKTDGEVPVAFLSLVPSKDTQGPLNLALLCSRTIYASRYLDGTPNDSSDPVKMGFGVLLVYTAIRYALGRQVGLELHASTDKLVGYYRSLGFLAAKRLDLDPMLSSDPVDIDRAYEDFLTHRGPTVSREMAPALFLQAEADGTGYPMAIPRTHLTVAAEKCLAMLTTKVVGPVYDQLLKYSSADDPTTFRVEPRSASKRLRPSPARAIAAGPDPDAPMADPIGLFFETVVAAARSRRRAAAGSADADGDTPMTLDTTTETDADGFVAIRGFTVARRTLLMYDFQEEKEGLGKLWVIVAPYLSEKDKINLSAAFGLGVADRVVLANRAQKKGNVPSEDQGKESFLFYKLMSPYTAVGLRFDRKGTASLIELLRRASGPQRARMQKRLTQDEEGDDAAPSKLVRTLFNSPEDDYDAITGNLLTAMIEAAKTLEVVGWNQFRSLAALQNIIELRYKEEPDSLDDPVSFVTSAVTYIRDTPAMANALLNLKTLELRAEKDQGRFTHRHHRTGYGLLFSDIPARAAGQELPVVLPHLKELVLSGTSVLRCADLDALGLIRFDVDWVPGQITDVDNVTVYTPRVTILQLAHLQARFVQQGTLYKPYFYSNSLVKFTCNGLPLGADSTIIQHRRNGRCDFPNATEISFNLKLCPTFDQLSVQSDIPALADRALTLTLPSHQFPSVRTLRVIVHRAAYRLYNSVPIDLYSLFIPDPTSGEVRLETPSLEQLNTNLPLFTHGPDGTRAIPFGAIPGSEEHQFPSLAIIEADSMTIQTTGTDFLALLPSLKLVTLDFFQVDTTLVDVPFEPLESNKDCIIQANVMIISTGGIYFNLGVRLVVRQIRTTNTLSMKLTGLRVPASSMFNTNMFQDEGIQELEIGNGLALANHPVWSDAGPLCFTRIQLPSTLVSFVDDSWVNDRVPRTMDNGAPASLDYLQLVNYPGNPLRIHSDLRYTRFVVAGPAYKRLNFSELEEILFIAVASYVAAEAHPWTHIRGLSVARELLDTRTANSESKEEYHAVKAHLEELDSTRCLVCLIIRFPDTSTARKIATDWLVQEYTADALGRAVKIHFPSELQAVRIVFKLPSNPGQLAPLLARLPTVVRIPHGSMDSVDYPRDISDFIDWSILRKEDTHIPYSDSEDDPRVYKWTQQRQSGGAIARAILDCHAHSVEGSDALGPEAVGQLKRVTHLTMNVSKTRTGTLADHIQAYWHPPLRNLLTDVVSLRLVTTDPVYGSKLFIRPPLVQVLLDRLSDQSKTPEPPRALMRLVCSGAFNGSDFMALGFITAKHDPLRGNPVTHILLPESLESIEIGRGGFSVNWRSVLCESNTLKRLCLRGCVPSRFHHWRLPALEVLELDLTDTRVHYGKPWLWTLPNLRELAVSLPIQMPFPLKGPLPEDQEITSVAEYINVINWRKTRLVKGEVYLRLPNLRTLKLRNVNWDLTDPEWLAPELVAVHTNVEYTSADATLIRTRFGPGFDFVCLSDSNLEDRLTTLLHDAAAVAYSALVTYREILPAVIVGPEFVMMHAKRKGGPVCLMVMLLEGPLRIQNTTYETLEQFQQLHTQFKSRYETNGIEELCYSFGQSVPLICLDFGIYLYKTNLRVYFQPRYDTDIADTIQVVYAPRNFESTIHSTHFARQVITTTKKAVYVTSEDTLDLATRLRNTNRLVTIGVSPSVINRLSFRTGPLATTLVQLHVDMPATIALPAPESIQTVGLVPLGKSLKSLQEVRCTGWQFEFGFLQTLGLGEVRVNGEYVLVDRLKMLDVTVGTANPGIFAHTISGVGLELLKITGASDVSPTGGQVDIQPHLWYLPRLRHLSLQNVLPQLQFPQAMRAWSFRTSLQSIDFEVGNPRDAWPYPVIVRHGLRLMFPVLQEYTFLSYRGEIVRPYELDELLVGGLCNDADSQAVTAWWTSVKADAQSPDLTLNRILPLPNWANHVLGTRLSFTKSVMTIEFTRYSSGHRDGPKTVPDGRIVISFNVAADGANRTIRDLFVETVLQRGLAQIDTPKRVGPDVIQGPDLAWVCTSPSPDTTEALTNWLEYMQTYQEVTFHIKSGYPKHVVCTIPFGLDVIQSMRHTQTLVIECSAEEEIAAMFATHLSEAALSTVERLIFRATTPMNEEEPPRPGTQKKWTLPQLRHLTFDGVPTRVWILESLGLLTDTYVHTLKKRRYVISRISDLDIFMPLLPENGRENSRSIHTNGFQSTTITKLTYRGGPVKWVNFHLPNLTHLDAGGQGLYDHGKLLSLFPRLRTAFPSIQVVQDLILQMISLQTPPHSKEPVQCFKRGDLFVVFAPNSTSNLAFALFIPLSVVKIRSERRERYMYEWFEDLVLGAPAGAADQTTVLLKDLARKGGFLVTFNSFQRTWSGEIQLSENWFTEPVDLGLLSIDEIRSAWTPIDAMVASAFAMSSNQLSGNASQREVLSTTYDGYSVDVKDRDFSKATIRGGDIGFPLYFFFYPLDISDVADNLVSSGTAGTSSHTEAQRDANVPPSDRSTAMPALNGDTIAETSDEAASTTEEEDGGQVSMWDWDTA